MNLPDITSRQDIDRLVAAFYEKATVDPLIGHFFTAVVPLDLATHLPVIAAFWERVLLHTGDYQGNPMLKHLDLARLSPLQARHMNRWLGLWEETVRQYYSGDRAEVAVTRARSIGQLMLVKIAQTGI